MWHAEFATKGILVIFLACSILTICIMLMKDEVCSKFVYLPSCCILIPNFLKVWRLSSLLFTYSSPFQYWVKDVASTIP